MHHTGTLAVALALGIPLVAVAGSVLVKVIKALREGPTPEDRKTMKDEVALLEELARELERMEDRIEALETILLEREKKGGGR